MSPAHIISLVLTTLNIANGVDVELKNGDFHMKAVLLPKRWHPTSGAVLYTTPEGINCHGHFHMNLRAKNALIEFDNSVCQDHNLMIKVGMHSKDYPDFLAGNPTNATYVRSHDSPEEQTGMLKLIKSRKI